ncbi:acetyl-CoA acetyltransferase [Acidihalobacter yilgarnensis]|uniref:Acetyl-CoA acetyltransferase n=1 Tax=Acidihalobacter yilgarnensis TaxID=2819280 RepID=A0A1D8IMG2_9GAMM|nr:acetyl-CoA C-acyltransferase [Acidihalobacter yilgarnensis]AOU97601.1 acetyl-CoA acetyltransferase [Acidihalobacter yilgarnensis]
MSEIVIVSARRTPIGVFRGALADLPAPALGAAAIRAAVADAQLAPDVVSEVIMGCVLSAGLGQAPARQAALAAGLALSVGCTTVNKVCGSGMKAIMFGHDLIRAGSAEVVVAGGMESMSGAPHLIPGSREGHRYGSFEVLDHMARDGLTDAYDGQPMGLFGEATAERYGFDRARQDAFAVASVERARTAQSSGGFEAELVRLSLGNADDAAPPIGQDEGPSRCEPSRIALLRPVFRRDGGTITAATASSIADGAAAMVLMSAETAAARGLVPLARIVGHAGHSQAPEWFTTAPVGAIERLLRQVGWDVRAVDLFEVNEAFAVVAMAVMEELGIDHARMNVNGGACALGHPIGASGARIVVTLLHALRARGLRRGVAALCIGGGEATAIAVERI